MANFNFNKVILGGRLTADPELKTTPSGVAVTSFTVAVNRRFGQKSGEEAQADFINVTARDRPRSSLQDTSAKQVPFVLSEHSRQEAGLTRTVRSALLPR